MPPQGSSRRIPAWRFGVEIDPFTQSAATLVVVLLAGGAAIEAYGDPNAAGPLEVARFEWIGSNGMSPALRTPLSEVLIGEGDTPAAANPPPGAAPAPPDPLQASVMERLVARPTPVSQALAKAPLPGLTSPGSKGFLPIIRNDGLTPFEAYRRPFQTDGRPRVGLIVSGLGFSAEITKRAIETLPPEVTLSFVPYAGNLQRWIDEARARGHEVVLEIPMEPFDALSVDTGPQTLLAGVTPEENRVRLEDLLSRAVGYCAVTNYQGGRFATSKEASDTFHRLLKSRGLGFVAQGVPVNTPLLDQANRQGVPFAAADRVLDVRRNSEAILGQLELLEAQARSNGEALGAGFAYPVTIEQVAVWSEQIEAKGMRLAPACALARTRKP